MKSSRIRPLGVGTDPSVDFRLEIGSIPSHFNLVDTLASVQSNLPSVPHTGRLSVDSRQLLDTAAAAACEQPACSEGIRVAHHMRHLGGIAGVRL